MELLLTGSTGFVGRNLLLRLTSDPGLSRIILPVRDPEKLRLQLAGEGISDARFHICRVTGDSWELPQGISPDLVVHAAGLLFGRRREDYFQTNVEGSLRLAAGLPRTARVIVLSSLAAGGPTPRDAEARGIHHEDRPVSLYGASKLTMERELRNRLGRRLLILRPPMVLGPRDAATLPLFKMAAGPIRIKPGFAPKHYSWIDVGDLCSAILAVAKAAIPDWQAHGPFYLGSDQRITDSELIATAAEVIEARGVTLSVPQIAIQLASLAVDAVPAWRVAAPSLGRDRVREILPSRWVCDGSVFPELFGWKPSKNLFQSLAETASWLRNGGRIR
ncbi:MAG: NAD-dependent epimerase/dehydratase family protein [Chthoniobacterales bacterium]